MENALKLCLVVLSILQCGHYCVIICHDINTLTFLCMKQRHCGFRGSSQIANTFIKHIVKYSLCINVNVPVLTNLVM